MKLKSIFGLYLAGIIGLSSSCTKLEDTYEDYIKDGEIVYRAKPVYVEAFLGNQRARIEWSLLFPTQVEKCLIYSDNQLLAEVPVVYNDSVRLSCLLENLEEKTYILDIYSEDKQGNRSIKAEQFVNIYGPRYISTLRTNREIKNTLRSVTDPGTVKIIISGKTSETLVSEIIYEDAESVRQIIKVEPDVDTITLTKVPVSGNLQIQDLSKPDSTCIDTFTAPAINYNIENLPASSNRDVQAVRDNVSQAIRLTFADAAANVLKTEVLYTDKNNHIQTLRVGPDTNVIFLENSPVSGEIRTVTYLKDEQDQPEYVTSYTIINVANIPMISKAWKIEDISAYQRGDGAPELLFDGVVSAGSIWHTPYNTTAYVKPGEDDEYPHWVVIDMGASRTISSFEVARRPGNNSFAKKIKFEVSEDGQTWSGEEFTTENVDGMQSFTLSTSLQGRYFKFTGLESWNTNTFMCVSELAVY